MELTQSQPTVHPRVMRLAPLLCLLLGCSADTQPSAKPSVSAESYTLGEMCDASSAVICQAWASCGIGWDVDCQERLRATCCPRLGPGWHLDCVDAAPASRGRSEACFSEVLSQSCEDLDQGLATPSCI